MHKSKIMYIVYCREPCQDRNVGHTHRIKRLQNRKVWFHIRLHMKEALPRHIAKFLISCSAKFEENFAEHEIKKFAKISRNYENENFAATLCTSGVRGVGGEPVQPGRTLRANADCALFVFLLYRFPFCHLLILWAHATTLAKIWDRFEAKKLLHLRINSVEKLFDSEGKFFFAFSAPKCLVPCRVVDCINDINWRKASSDFEAWLSFLSSQIVT